MLSSYCYTVMSIPVMALYRPKSIMDFLFYFFDYYSEFNWETQVLTVKGGINFSERVRLDCDRRPACLHFPP